jgi:cytochrome c oxidase subunit II
LDVRLHLGKIFAILLAFVSLTSIGLFVSRHWWMPAPATRHASDLDRLVVWAMIDAGVAFLLAQILLAALAWKFHANSTARPLTSAARVALIVSVLFISLELFSAATLGRRAWGSMFSVPSGVDAVRAQVMGQQFAYYFRYPGRDGEFGPIHVEKIDPSVGNYFGLDTKKDLTSRDDLVSASLVLPVNQPVELILNSQDVVHSFYVRELRVQQDMVPGMQIPLRFTPTRIGKYEIACTQLCGLGHYRMRAYLEVVSVSDFQKWMQAHEQ